MNIYYIAIVSFFISVILCPLIIPVLRRLKFGQSIREIGPSWHNKKSGTPTMGGIIFIISTLITLLFFLNKLNIYVIFVLFCSLGFGLIGFIDDFIKVILKRNLGLKSWQKLAMQLVVSILFVMFGLETGVLSTVIVIPFLNLNFDIGLSYIPFAVFVIVGVVNSVNLTDGIDGLATSITAVVTLFLAILAFSDLPSVSFFSLSVFGALLGFLLFNKYPAKVFMGDTGSLYLGGVVVSVALLIKNPIVLIIVGFIYVCESLSVIIQVTSFKLTGKRVFKMSPIHHHFEMCGWNEKKIVFIFTFITLALSIIAFLGSGVI